MSIKPFLFVAVAIALVPLIYSFEAKNGDVVDIFCQFVNETGGITCTRGANLSVFFPAATTTRTQLYPMTNIADGSGTYNVSFSTGGWTNGVYRLLCNCTAANNNTYYVSDLLNLKAKTLEDQINDTEKNVSNINTVVMAINTTSIQINNTVNDIKTNVSNLWSVINSTNNFGLISIRDLQRILNDTKENVSNLWIVINSTANFGGNNLTYLMSVLNDTKLNVSRTWMVINSSTNYGNYSIYNIMTNISKAMNDITTVITEQVRQSDRDSEIVFLITDSVVKKLEGISDDYVQGQISGDELEAKLKSVMHETQNLAQSITSYPPEVESINQENGSLPFLKYGIILLIVLIVISLFVTVINRFKRTSRKKEVVPNNDIELDLVK